MLLFGGDALILLIYELNFSLKCGFRSIQEKISEIFPCGAFVSFVEDESFIEMSVFQITYSALKNSW